MFKIKKEFIEVLKPISGVINSGYLINSIDRPLFLPFYHLVTDNKPEHLSALYDGRRKKQFTEDLEYFLKYFSAIDLHELNQLSRSKPHNHSGKPPIHLSFDDGLLNCSEIVAPVLKEKGIPATFFVTKNFVEHKTQFYRFEVSKILNKVLQSTNKEEINILVKNILLKQELWNKNTRKSLLALNQTHLKVIEEIKELVELIDTDLKIFMDKEDVTALRKDGFTIGAHSISHPLFSVMSDDEIKIEIKESVNWVKDNFEMNIKAFAFPFSDDGVSMEIFEWLFDDKQPILDLAFGTAGLKMGCHSRHLQRVPMEMYHGSTSRRVKAEYLYHRIRKAVVKEKSLMDD